MYKHENLLLDYDPLEGYRDPQTYDQLDDPSNDADHRFIEKWVGAQAGPVLDIACGTGTMALRLARQGVVVTGLDVVPEMIAWASQKAASQGLAAEWITADARGFHLGKQFRHIYMIGNAFQHMLTRPDQEALLSCVREHLQPDGYFIFGTRNPSLQNLMQTRYAEPQSVTFPDGRQLTFTEDQFYDPITQIQHYTFHNRWMYLDGAVKNTTDKTALRYVFPQEMETLLHYNGFRIREGYGSWQQEPFTATSPYMIYICQQSNQHELS